MNDARRYRLNAAECLSAAQTCTPPYRGLALDMATSWLALAHQTEAEDELITIWNVRGGNPAPGAEHVLNDLDLRWLAATYRPAAPRPEPAGLKSNASLPPWPRSGAHP
jgi:hypothetical protein